MGSRIGKNSDFGVHLGANWRLKTSSFLPFSKTRSFIFNKMVASVVSKNNLFPFLLSSLSARPFDFPPLPRLVPNPSREWQTIVGYKGRAGMSSEKWVVSRSPKEAGFEFLIRLEWWVGLFPRLISQRWPTSED
jgi:hypothetical protein